MGTLHEQRLSRQQWRRREERLAERLQERTIDALLDRVCKIPDPMDTLEQWVRGCHEDLAGMTRDELLVERARVRQRLLIDPRPAAWLGERAAALEAALT